MTVRNFTDQGFDDYRKARKRMQAKIGAQGQDAGYENHALRELEKVEAKEFREQQLTREVHDFFAAATKQAAAIVDRVAQDVQQMTGERVEQEMESFLIDSLTRMNTLVMTVLQQRRGPIAETQLEPRVANLVGAPLDEFRWAGTAETGDRHIGQDPFATAVDEVQREFRQQVPASSATDDAVPIDQHLVASVASVEQPDQATEPVPAPVAASASAAVEPSALPSVTPTTRTSSAVAPRPPEPAAAAVEPNPNDELERFKSALRALVKQGVMTKDEARAAWQTRLQALGRKA